MSQTVSEVVADRSRRAATEIAIVHPSSAHFATLLMRAALDQGFSARFLTGFQFRDDGALGRLIARLPYRLAKPILRELRRRDLGSLPADRVIGRAREELAFVMAARLWRNRTNRVERIMLWRNRRFDRWAADRIVKSQPDIVVGYDTSALQSIRAGRAAGAVTVLNQLIGHLAIGDALLSEESRVHPEWADSMHAGAPQWLIEQCRQEALEADYVLSPSDYVTRSLTAIGVPEARIRFLPFGVRVERFKPADTPRIDGKFRVLYVGQISQRKGLKYLLDAVKSLALPDLELVLVGGLVGAGAGLASYQGWFRHVPNVPHGEIEALFQSADLFVYPSLHEGSALAIFEAMACGLPVVTTENSGSMVRDGIEGRIVPLRDPAALAEAILAIRDNPDARAMMALAARARALEFSTQAYAARLATLLDSWSPRA